MANDKYYIRQIYINGSPYLIRDEECQTAVQQLKIIYNNMQKDINNSTKIISDNFDKNGYLIGGINWSIGDYKSKAKNSKIPYFTLETLANNELNLKIGFN